MWLNLRTEYSFGAVYGPLENIVSKLSEAGVKAAGIADLYGTWGHVRWKIACEKNKIKPIFGTRLPVCESTELKDRRQPFDLMSFIALTDKGLNQIYEYVNLAHDQFYYKPLLSYNQINSIDNKDVAVICQFSPRLDLIERHVYLELSPATPIATRNLKGIDYIACCDNWFMNKGEEYIYEPLAEDRKRERKTSPMHILSTKEWKKIHPDRPDAIKARNKLLKKANAHLQQAHMIRYSGKDDITDLCKKGAKEKGISLKKEPYKSRYKREMKLIREKDYVDYFLVVADVINYSKKYMLVGHSRGSSAGSLVCYLMGITEIDPIPHGLVFERFIDVNRYDLPDIDIDFQYDKRHLVVKYLQNKYGKECVAKIGNVARLKPKSAIERFAKALKVPLWDVDDVKDAIFERSGGDARAALCIFDTFQETDIGKAFIDMYPSMSTVTYAENHASHTSTHAAGLLVCNEPITYYCGINSRDNDRVAMIDKKDAEKLNLLKIDALGLRTLSIIAEVCDKVGIKYKDLYALPLDDKKAYKVFKNQRYTGIFQFEGDAVQQLAKQMPVENIQDISALSALGRPGPLATGGALTFINRRSGKERVTYISDSQYVVDQTKETYGVIIYQEQVMNIGREYGGLSWEDVSELRKAMSKSLGDEFFGKYKEKFITGAKEKGATAKDAEIVWKNMNTMGSWSFNKSHAVSYGMITYLCAYMKAHYPLEFAVASLNNAKDNRSALRLLRDLRENDNIKHKAFSVKNSQKGWTVHKGKLLGGLTTVDGIGPANANKIIKLRDEGHALPPGIQKHINAGVTPFKYLYPAKQLYGHFYKNGIKFDGKRKKVSKIKNLTVSGTYVVIGCLIKKVVRDANESTLVSKRGYRMDGDTTYINITIEDDTGGVGATVGRNDYDELGKEIAESGTIDKDWYLLVGNYNSDWNRIHIEDIRRITDDKQIS